MPIYTFVDGKAVRIGPPDPKLKDWIANAAAMWTEFDTDALLEVLRDREITGCACLGSPAPTETTACSCHLHNAMAEAVVRYRLVNLLAQRSLLP